MYLYGGSQNFNSNMKMYSLNLKTFAWAELKTKRHECTPESLDEHTAVVFNRQMIVFAGFDKGYRSNKVHILDLKTFVWDFKPVEGSQPCPRTGHSAAIHSSNMVVFGGKSDEN